MVITTPRTPKIAPASRYQLPGRPIWATAITPTITDSSAEPSSNSRNGALVLASAFMPRMAVIGVDGAGAVEAAHHEGGERVEDSTGGGTAEEAAAVRTTTGLMVHGFSQPMAEVRRSIADESRFHTRSSRLRRTAKTDP